MKSIAVLTDYSESSVQATRLAMHVAKKLKLRVLLFSNVAIPSVRDLEPVGAPLNYPAAGTDDKKDLEEFAIRMEHDLQTRSFDGCWMPPVSFNDAYTQIEDIMTIISANSDIMMVVIPVQCNIELAAYLQADACSRIIDWAGVPVLVVPDSAAIRNFEKVAFATNLHDEDINSIGDLGNLLAPFSAEIMVTHLNDIPQHVPTRKKEQQLSADLYSKLHCGGVYFRSIPDTSTQKNWDFLNAHKHSDLLVLVQQPRNQLISFFKRGENKNVTYHLTIPVLIMPRRG